MSKLIIFSGGDLARLYPNGIELEGRTVAECLTGLSNFDGFRLEGNKKRQVIIPGFLSKDSLYEPTDVKTIKVVEIVEGAGGKVGAFLMIAIGVLLIATGWGAAAGVSILGVSISASTLVSVGAMLVIQGVIALLTPAPKASKWESGEKSNYISGAGRNTVKIGTRIPLLFGEVKAYGHYLSFNVTAEGVVTPPETKEMPENTGSQYMGAGGFRGNPDDDYVVVNNTDNQN